MPEMGFKSQEVKFKQILNWGIQAAKWQQASKHLNKQNKKIPTQTWSLSPTSSQHKDLKQIKNEMTKPNHRQPIKHHKTAT